MSSDLINRVNLILDDDLEQLVTVFAHTAAEYRMAKAKAEVYKRYREKVLAEGREEARSNTTGKLTVSMAEDRALVSDVYAEFLDEYEAVLHDEARLGAQHDALEKRIDYLRSMLAYARAELTLN